MSSIVDGLLFEIYDRWHYNQRDSLDSDTFTECSSTSDAFLGRSDSIQLDEVHQVQASRHSAVIHRSFLENKGIADLSRMLSELEHRVGLMSARLIRQLKHRDRRLAKLHRNYDIITAILQASSLKRRIDTRMKFSVQPLPGEDAFQQWHDAMKAVARLPMGIPPEFRKKIWLSLADQHIGKLKVDWEKTRRFAFNERSNPDDNKLGLQIVKDLHRTGCSSFNGQDSEEDRAVLKRVLLAYARWNKAVGYCQGFNVLAALILDVVERREDDALKVMVLLIDHVLPDSYFANNLRALSVDMAVFRDLLGIYFPKLSRHLDKLQAAARDDTTGANYEPPLTNVFTMQWFLTLFATCLPKMTALRIWDSVLLEGSEILLRTALAIWGKLQDRILAVQSADEFYTTMGLLTQEMLDNEMLSADDLIKAVYSVAPFPFPQLLELREKYTYNITPFTAAMSVGSAAMAVASSKRARGSTSIFSDEDDLDEDELADAVNCFSGLLPTSSIISMKTKAIGDIDRNLSSSNFDISKISPGAFAATPELSSGQGQKPAAYVERMNMDIHSLKKQYTKLRQRQKQAHIILANASAKHKANERAKQAMVMAPIETPTVVNHLFIAKNGLGKKNRKVTGAPCIAPFYPGAGVAKVVMSEVRVQEAKSQVNQKSNGAGGGSHADPPHREEQAEFQQQELQVGNREAGGVIGTGGDGLGTVEGSCARQTQGKADGSSGDQGEAAALQSSDTQLMEHISLIDMDDTDELAADSGRSAPHQQDKTGSGDGHRKQTDAACTETDQTGEGAGNCSKPTQDTVEKNDENANIPQYKPLSKSETCKTGESLNMDKGSTSGGDTDLQDGTSSVPSSEPSSPIRDLPSGGISRRYSSDTHSYSVRLQEYSPSVITSSEDSDSSQGSPVHDTQKMYYNPFPGRHISHNKAQNGIKLGLYSRETVPAFEGGIQKKLGLPNIGRAQINACLHRQYMVGVKHDAKTSKR